jgi:phytoene synthase
MATPEASLSFCGQEVRRNDRDRFLACLFAPPDRREALFGLYAFNVEIAKTREVVTQATLGQIRLQWWREALDELYAGTVRRHEVLQCLAPFVAEGGLSRAHFETALEARELDLEDEPPADLAALEAYAEGTSASLSLLALEALGVRGAAAEAAARHVGAAWALTGLLRAVPRHAASHRVYLPRDLLDAHGVSTSRLFDGKRQEGLAAVVRTVAGRARERLRLARADRREVPRAALPALLPAVMADTYLGALERAGWDPTDARVQMQHPFLQLRLGLRALAGRY